MKRFLVKAYPYAVQFGRIEVPDEIADSDDMNAVSEYIEEHFDDIRFGLPRLNYTGAYFECEEDDEK